MLGWVGRFGRFWYLFVVGEDWLLAGGCLLALAVTYGLSRAGVPSWWLVPAAILLLLPLSVWRAARRRT